MKLSDYLAEAPAAPPSAAGQSQKLSDYLGSGSGSGAVASPRPDWQMRAPVYGADYKTPIDPATQAKPPETTAGGVAASAARGLAPWAAGAGAGALFGGPPGAAVGLGMVGAAELGGMVYNPVAHHFGLPEMATPSAMTDKALDALGIHRPSTTLERGVEGAAGFVGGGAGALGSRAGRETAKIAAEAAGKGVESVADLLSAGSPERAERWIEKMYPKAVGPSTRGRDTAAQRRSAISEIVENKPFLEYTTPAVDGTGMPVVTARGRVPESLNETAQAIDISKDRLVQQWRFLEDQAGAAGAFVDAAPLVQALRKEASSPSLLRTESGGATSSRMHELADRYEAAGKLKPSEANDDLVKLNAKLKGYYKAPSPLEPAEKLVAEHLRKGLDETIENTTAPGYADLKRRWGALRSIEDDIDKADRRVANWRAGGGVTKPVTNAIAGMEAAHGVFTGSLREVVAGGALKGLQTYAAWRSQPNEVIKRIFQKAEKYHAPPQGPRLGDAPEPPLPQYGGGMQPPPPTGPGQNIYGGRHTPGVSGGTQGPLPPSPPPGQTGGAQPPRPGGLGQSIQARAGDQTPAERLAQSGQATLAQPVPTYRPGAQPPYPPGPGQEVYGGPLTAEQILAQRSALAAEALGLRPRSNLSFADEFGNTVVGGGSSQ